MEESQPATPYKEQQYEKEVEDTGYKPQSKISYQEPQQPEEQEAQPTLIERLDKIQKDIREDEERLKQIAEEKKGLDVNGEDYINLEDQRRILRKEIVDLDYRHKKFYKLYKKEQAQIAKKERQESERKNEQRIQQIKRIQQEERLERSRRLEKQLQEIHQSSKKRREQIQKLYKNPKKQQVKQQAKQEVKEQKVGQQQAKEKTEQQKQAQAKHQARVAEIQAQLASQRLRRSRQVQLQTELIRIRSYTPYYWWRNFASPYYPYLYTSLYAYYRSSLYFDPLIYSRYRYPLYSPYYPLI